MTNSTKQCSFCGTDQSPNTPLIAGAEGHICEACVRLANQVVTSWGRKRAMPELRRPLPTPEALKQRLDEYIIGQDLAKEILCVAVYNHYKRFVDEGVPARMQGNGEDVELGKSNVLLYGPTGTGKTLLASTLARVVGVPFAIADATTLTQAGYVGEDVESILVRLLDVAEGNVARAEWGIVYLDEVDKLARSQESGVRMRDISGEGVQQSLLKLVEGTQVKLSVKGRRRGEGGEEVMMDTSNILFIAGGAFSGLEEVVSRRVQRGPAGIGFHAAMEDQEQKLSVEKLISSVEPEDLRRFGLIPEFIGRFPVFAALEPLDEAALVTILTQPRNAVTRQFCKLFSLDGVELEFTPEALTAVARRALERNTGARGLRGVLENVLRETMFRVPSNTNVVRCIVDEDAVQGNGKVRYEEAEAGAKPAPESKTTDQRQAAASI